MKKLFQDSFFAIFNKGCYFGLRLLILFFYSKVAPSFEFSSFIYLLSLVEIFRLVIDFGIDTVYIRIIATNDNSHGYLNDIISLKFYLTAIGYFLLTSLAYFVLKKDGLNLIFSMGLLLPITAISLFITTFFQAKGKNKLLSPFFLMVTLFNLAFAFFFRNSGQYNFIFYIASELSFLLAGLVAIYIYYPFTVRLRFSLRNFINIYSNSKLVGLTQTICAAYGKTDIIFLEHLSQSTCVAQYGFFNRFIDPFLMVSSITSTTAYSFFSKKVDILNPDLFYQNIKRFFFIIFFYALLVAATIALLLPVLLIYIKSKYMLAPQLAFLFGALTLLRILNGVLVSIFYTLLKYNVVLIVSISNIFLMVAFYFLLIPKLQVQGVLLSSLIPEAFGFLAMLAYINRHFTKLK